MGKPTEHHESSMDFRSHRETYDGFIRLFSIGAVWCLIIVAGLAIGGTVQRWWLCAFLILIGTIASVLGAAVKSWGVKPAVGVLVLSLLALLLVNY